MYNLKILIIALICVIFFSCKKENQERSPEFNVINVYGNLPNKTDALLADVYDASNSTTTYFYGSFNNNGVPKDIKSLILENKSSDTLLHYILDNSNRVTIAYSSLKNSTKLNTVIKMDYSVANQVTLSLYSYNWLNNLDTLIKQITYDYINNTGTIVYGKIKTQTKSDDFEANELNPLKNGMLTNERIFGAAIFVSIGVCIVAPPICPTAAGFIIGSTILLSGQIAKSAELKTIQNPIAPQSPTSSLIPNPTGTPANPTGIPGAGAGIATFIRNEGGGGSILTNELDLRVSTNGYNACGVEILYIVLGDLGSVYEVPRKNGTYQLNAESTCSAIFSAWNMSCGNDNGGTITLSGNNLSLHWEVDSSSDGGCSQKVWDIDGSWK